MGFSRRLVSNAGRALQRLSRGQVMPNQGGNWLEYDLAGGVPERTLPHLGRAHLGLLDLLRVLAQAGGDPRIDGVLLRLRGHLASWSQAQSLRRAVDQLRAAGKRVVVWGESLTAEQYLVASGADRVLMPESGSLMLVGLRVERFYLKEMLERLGARPDVVHIGEFKTAGDTFTRQSMSQEELEQIDGWQSDLFDALVEGIAVGRSLDAQTVRDRIDRGPYTGASAIEAGLVDGLCYADELPDLLTPLAPEPPASHPGARRVHPVPLADYGSAFAPDAAWQPLFADRPVLAYVLALGNISSGGGRFGLNEEGFGQLLESLRERPEVRGVLLRIDSPGGDALTSDLLHRRLEQLLEEKPVVVSMGDVVASGGYYIAAAADRVFVESGAITGSIGVVGGKLDLSGLYERLGVSKDGVQKGARAGLMSEARAFNPDERRAIRGQMEAIYETFLARVGEGRNLSRAELDKIARGRIWSGLRALEIGLVDEIGGPLQALHDLSERAGLRADEPFDLATLPRPGRLNELIGRLDFGARVRSLRLAG